MNNKTFDMIMRSAGSKINFAKNSLMGPNNKYRDESGFVLTASRMLSALENMLDTGSSTKFSIDEAMLAGLKRNFSKAKGSNFSASDLESVSDVEVIDIAIASTLMSHGLTYFAMERPMNAATQSINFQGLKAVNSAGGFTAGQTVLDPRTGLPTSINLGRDGATVTTGDIAGNALAASYDLAAPVVLGTTKIYFTPDGGSQVLVAKGSGVRVVESGVEYEYMVYEKTAILADGVRVNLATGVVTGLSDITAGMTAADTVVINSVVDRIAESDGAHTLKLRPFNDTVELESSENRVILNSSVETTAYMNKIYRQNARYGVAVDFGKRAIDQVVSLYTYFIDVLVMKTLYELAVTKSSLGTIDVSGFDYDAYKTSKNDVLSNGVRALTSTILTNTGNPATALAVDTVAANVLATDSDNMKLVPAFDEVRDGLIGSYNGVPVIRNSYLNGKATTGNGLIMAAHKSKYANAAPVAFGEYLPPYSTIPAVNPNNPGELSQALFSQTACKGVVGGFVERIEVTPYVTI